MKVFILETREEWKMRIEKNKREKVRVRMEKKDEKDANEVNWLRVDSLVVYYQKALHAQSIK